MIFGDRKSVGGWAEKVKPRKAGFTHKSPAVYPFSQLMRCFGNGIRRKETVAKRIAIERWCERVVMEVR